VGKTPAVLHVKCPLAVHEPLMLKDRRTDLSALSQGSESIKKRKL
jgi:hypothetical protein